MSLSNNTVKKVKTYTNFTVWMKNNSNTKDKRRVIDRLQDANLITSSQLFCLYTKTNTAKPLCGRPEAPEVQGRKATGQRSGIHDATALRSVTFMTYGFFCVFPSKKHMLEEIHNNGLLLKKSLKTQHNFHETLLNDHPVFEYYDLDNCPNEKTVEEFMKYREQFGGPPISKKDVRIKKSINQEIQLVEKHSFHLIIRSCVWEINTLKYFALSFYEYLKTTDFPVECIDKSIYTNHKSMRTIYSSKPDQNRPFFPQSKHPLNEFFIQMDIRDDPDLYPINTTWKIPLPVNTRSNNLSDVSTDETVCGLSGEMELLPRAQSMVDEFLNANPEFVLKYRKGNHLYLQRISPSVCLCDPNTTHHTQNAYILITYTAMRFYCYEHTGDGVYLGNYNPLTAEQRKQFARQQLLEAINEPLCLEGMFRSNVTLIEFSSHYVPSTLFQNTPLANSVQCIKSPTGSGKSYFIKHQILPNYNDKRIVVLSFRRSFATFISQQFGLENYMTMTNCEVKKSRRLCISVENLWRLNTVIHKRKPYDLLILDEVCSLLLQVNCAKTNRRNLQINQTVFQKLLDTSHTVIAMDGNLNTFAVQTIQHLTRHNIVVHINTCVEPMRKLVIVEDKNTLYDILKQKVSSGCKVAIPYTVSQQECQVLFESDGFRNINGHSITRETPNKQHLFENLNEVSQQYDAIAFTQTLLAGCSIENRDYKVATAFISPNTTNPEQTVQMLDRFRFTDVCYMYIDNSYSSKPLFKDTSEVEEYILKKIGECGLQNQEINPSIYDEETHTIKDKEVKYISYLQLLLDGYYSKNYNSELIKMLKYNRWSITVQPLDLRSAEPNENEEKYSVNDNQSDIKLAIENKEIFQGLEIIHANDITDEDYERFKNMANQTEDEIFQCKRHIYKKFYNVQQIDREQGNFTDYQWEQLMRAYAKKISYHIKKETMKRAKTLKKIICIKYTDDNVPIPRSIHEDIVMEDNSTDYIPSKDTIKISNARFLSELKSFKHISFDCLTIIAEFIPDNLSKTMKNQQDVLSEIKTNKISTNILNIREYRQLQIIINWVRSLGFKSIFDRNTIITQKQKNDSVWRMCHPFVVKHKYEAISTLFESKQNFKAFQKFISTKNYTALSRFITSKMKSFCFLELVKTRARVDGVLSYTYKLKFSKKEIDIIGDTSNPSLFNEHEFQDVPNLMEIMQNC